MNRFTPALLVCVLGAVMALYAGIALATPAPSSGARGGHAVTLDEREEPLRAWMSAPSEAAPLPQTAKCPAPAAKGESGA